MTDLEKKLEAILFHKGEPVAIRFLMQMTGASEKDVASALNTLQETLRGHGLRLLIKDGEALLVTSEEVSGLIEMMHKEELSRDIGKAGIETLAIILYKGPLSRSEVDYIRGVNSAFILRNLLVRGLIERTSNPKDQRSYLYRPTFDLLQFLGISSVEELPDYDTVLQELETFVKEILGDEKHHE